MRQLVWGLGLVLASAASAGDLTFEDRVRAEEAIQRLSYAHQIGATEAFEQAFPRERLEQRVRTTLGQSAALASYWNTPITAEALRNEIERIARNTRFPDRLLAIYDALGNDPVLVQECLARATLADRWTRAHFESDPRTHTEIPTIGWDAWWEEASITFASQAVPVVATGAAPLPLPQAAGATCHATDSWDNGSLGAVPEGRSSASAVWTGRLMIVWGGSRDGRTLVTGGRYDPLTDAWSPTSTTGAPSARWGQTASWTGTRMIVWGGALAAGGGSTATGAAYDPIADAWTPVSAIGAPSPRQYHAAVWTGSRLVVWGGSFGDTSGTHFLDDGGRYDPATDTWTPMSSAGAPLGRRNHTAVWTGSRMIVWGGDRADGTTMTLDTGGRYDPVGDAWLPTSALGAPSGRTYHGAAWTGAGMVVWGGQFYPAPGQRQFLGTGARYDPASDTWSPVSPVSAPSARIGHAMVAVGSLVLVWGGQGATGWTNQGGRYDANSDTWSPMTSIGAPSPRTTAAAVWTGSRLIVWSGTAAGVSPDSGGRYDPALDQWTPTFSQNAPPARQAASSVWTGNVMIVWGGLKGEEPVATGGRYDPTTDSWTPTSESPLNRSRVYHTAVWTGSRMLIWGGEPCPAAADKGTSYDPISDTWAGINFFTEPAPRRRHTAVWTGSRMVVWGGLLCNAPASVTESGSRYDPAANTWSPTASTGAPSARQSHTGVWTGTSMIVWGGGDETGSTLVNSGGRYDPVSDVWSTTRKQGAPAARRDHTAVWTGSSMIVWGGTAGADLDTGGRYDPAADQWAATSTTNAPSPRVGHAAVWADSVMVVWGGDTSAVGTIDSTNTGGRYNPVANVWTPTSTAGAPEARTQPSAVWTGTFVVVWGGVGSYAPDSGGRYVVTSPDGDLDGVADACDCAPGNPGVFAVPPEVGNLAFGSDKATLSWSSALPGGGSSTVHDGIAGALTSLPVSGDAGVACVGPGTAGTSVSDSSVPPPGQGRWYLVRGRNSCGAGTFGAATGGAERLSNVCP
jgi:hypothetical protein